MSDFPTLLSPDANQPPNSEEAEKAVLGSILINEQCLQDIRLFLKGEDFFLAKHKWVWESICALADRTPPENIDNITVTQVLRDRKQLEDIGGWSYITQLINDTPTHIHAITYGRIVERAAIRRRLLDAAGDIAKIALEENAEIQVVLEKSREAFNKAANVEIEVEETMISISDIADQHYNQLEIRTKQYDEDKKASGIPTGFLDLDKLLGNMQPSELLIVAARPKVGKTSFMLSVCLNAAKLANANVAIFTREMSSESLYNRLASMESGINSLQFRNGNMTAADWSAYTGLAFALLKGLPIFMDENTGTTLGIKRKCQRLADAGKLDLICVDYLQLVKPSANLWESGKTEKGKLYQGGNRTDIVGEVARQLKEIATYFRVPLLTGSQLNRDLESRSDKHPNLSDLRESGEIEQSGDVLMSIYRDELYNKNSDKVNQADIEIMAARNVGTGIATLYFQKELTRFANMTRQSVNLMTGEIL